ncbi:hypothetical protein P872_18670 [Rhodonellum psychrophilum GCM71 = DSM 17998]|uniref:Uncharacterized protein n=1 Tax=Rhodonellum psychrophilum GCM71 = DSM 17998 TaxID=1123057 RepID=U5BXL1_9BACT|nr:hypothetical protein P872_18670 [Rhodonellum psychrophilum GCM71 = DSM 17998]
MGVLFPTHFTELTQEISGISGFIFLSMKINHYSIKRENLWFYLGNKNESELSSQKKQPVN